MYDLTIVTPQRAWSCQKRYSQFESLHDQIIASHATPSHPNPDLPAGCILPPKRPKMIVSHTDPSFIEERRILLQLWCRRMNSVRDIADSDVFKRFFQSDVLEGLVGVPEDTFVFPPDAEITQVDVPNARMMSDHVLYKIDLSNARKRSSFSQWSVLKRFVQFHDMHAAVCNDFAHSPYFLSTLPQPPSKSVKLMVDHKDKHFVEQRRVLLEHYLQRMVRVPQVAKNQHFLQFCGVEM